MSQRLLNEFRADKSSNKELEAGDHELEPKSLLIERPWDDRKVAQNPRASVLAASPEAGFT